MAKNHCQQVHEPVSRWLQQQFSIQFKASICVKDFFAHLVPRVPEAATLQVCFFDLLKDGGSY